MHLNSELSEAIPKLNESLIVLKSVYGSNSLNVAIAARVLSEIYFDQNSYQLSLKTGMIAANILEQKKGLQDSECIAIHLHLAFIAEKTEKYHLSVRFLNKLFLRLKKDCEQENINILLNVHKIGKSFDIISNSDKMRKELKLLAVNIARLKLKMTTMNKRNIALRKWKTHKKQSQRSEKLLIQNLCLNPIKKSNDLLKIASDGIEVAAWINIIKKFEKSFLGM